MSESTTAGGRTPPYVNRARVTLRVLGTSVTLLDCIRDQARRDLGIDLRFEVLDGVAAQRVGVLSPETFDIYDQWFHNVDFVWPAAVMQPIDAQRIRYWPEVNALPKTGRLVPHAALGAGCNPVDRLYVQPDGTFGSRPSERLTMLPVCHNADSFGYRTDMLPSTLADRRESWAWLVDPSWSGRISIQNDGAIGALDAALAIRASDDWHPQDIGNLTVAEIDGLMERLVALKKKRCFSAFWDGDAEVTHGMAAGDIAIGSLWSPALAELRRLGAPIRLAAPEEGYRAWYGGMSIARHVTGRTLDAAYDYMNWWLSGWPGAIMARQGYYIANPARSREHLSDAEWGYWYQGRPAARDLPGPRGEPGLIRRGEVRDGGDYHARMSRIAVWNSVMDEHNYLVRRWHQMVGA
ncbi:PotD/PotF family extracellular solute-binding protein [Salinisphaera sp. Q1T1-3]|uniref:ABC transporter substrate-binding protein n=1 Tax=Salinisphaera sp. Q1T1-3 TaxID=2321229 RepID=UPI000E75FADF|nr:extracellular solute-binding protein [Salinisphaera sp. Q1T1-3]RJS92744.1 extracellular solute-binding protein [Salinisphaera sp. Q1T1-3]